VVRIGVSIILKENFKDINLFTVKKILETISFVKEKSVDLIILGINAPRGKNREMIHNIRTHQPDVKILIFFLLMTIIAVANILLREQMDI
jgi:DNA-binding NarL/FixJ family response regulator